MPVAGSCCSEPGSISVHKYIFAHFTQVLSFFSRLLGNGLRFPLEPISGNLIVLKVMMSLLPHLRVVTVQPLNLGVAKERWLNQVTANRSHGNMLKA